ncbi:hypothetical protein SDC9_113730 [bioreactor metagenome]|uniref:Uncharacterized protein n=1 Tax=bioreactor metagenome TaxID=1076179 RepID=A0A645BNW6_9ZZZZ
MICNERHRKVWIIAIAINHFCRRFRYAQRIARLLLVDGEQHRRLSIEPAERLGHRIPLCNRSYIVHVQHGARMGDDGNCRHFGRRGKLIFASGQKLPAAVRKASDGQVDI